MRFIPAFLLGLAACTAHARVGLVVGEPFGAFGTMMPAGHAGILLDDYCADGPLHIRACAPNERPGVVISRYHDLRHPALDWLAVPAAVFFYGAEDPNDAPTFVTPTLEGELRARYRAAHLADVIPAGPDGHEPAYGDWAESIGAAFDRRLFVYRFEADPADEASLVDHLNSTPNRRRYTLGRHNCADFAADLLKIVLPPGTIRRNRAGDFDMMSPKQLARLMDTFAEAHPDRHVTAYELPQLPGTLRRSRPMRGASETFLKTKRYLATLLIIQPELVLADWIIYEDKGKWHPTLAPIPTSPTWLNSPAELAHSPAGALTPEAQ